MTKLPQDIRKDALLSKIRSAAKSWEDDTKCPFRLQHRKNLEQGDYGSKKEIAAHFLFALKHCSGAGGRYNITAQTITEFQTSLQYLQHIGVLEGNSTFLAENILAELRQRHLTSAGRHQRSR